MAVHQHSPVHRLVTTPGRRVVGGLAAAPADEGLSQDRPAEPASGEGVVRVATGRLRPSLGNGGEKKATVPGGPDALLTFGHRRRQGLLDDDALARLQRRQRLARGVVAGRADRHKPDIGPAERVPVGGVPGDPRFIWWTPPPRERHDVRVRASRQRLRTGAADLAEADDADTHWSRGGTGVAGVRHQAAPG